MDSIDTLRVELAELRKTLEIVEKERALLRTLLDQRPEKARLFLYHISEAAQTIQTLKTLFPAIHTILKAMMPAKNFYIALYDEAANTLDFPYYVDEYWNLPTQRDLWKRIAEYILRTQQPVLATPEVFKLFAKSSEIVANQAHPGCWLGVPLKTHGKIIGVLAVQSYAEGVRYGEEEKRLLIFVSTQIAAAIERVRTEEELENYREHLEELVSARTAELTEANERLQQEIAERKRIEESLQQHSRTMSLLTHLGELINVCRTEKETYPKVLSICKLLFPQDAGSLCLREQSQGELELVGIWGDNPPDPRALSADNLLLPFLEEHPPPEPSKSGKKEFDTSMFLRDTYLCIPISTLEDPLGMFSLRIRNPSPGHADQAFQQMQEAKRLVMNRVAQSYALALSNLRLRETLRIESIRDPLTGLYNRRHMEESLAREAIRAEHHQTSVGLIMLDVDHFKQFNDTHGHEAGDMVLREVGLLLRQNLRGEDIACRYGGEEFLLILPEMTLKNAGKLAEELRLKIEHLPISFQDAILHVTISMGVAALSDHGPHVKEAVNAADAALYQAKKQGRNRVVAASCERCQNTVKNRP